MWRVRSAAAAMNTSGLAISSEPAEWCSPIHASAYPRSSSVLDQLEVAVQRQRRVDPGLVHRRQEDPEAQWRRVRLERRHPPFVAQAASGGRRGGRRRCGERRLGVVAGGLLALQVLGRRGEAGAGIVDAGLGGGQRPLGEPRRGLGFGQRLARPSGTAARQRRRRAAGVDARRRGPAAGPAAADGAARPAGLRRVAARPWLVGRRAAAGAGSSPANRSVRPGSPDPSRP